MSNAAPDTPQPKKVSNKPGDQLSTTSTTDSYFKLPFEHNPTARLSSSAHRPHRNPHFKRSDPTGNSLLDRWTELSSEDSYSSRPPDCFSTEVSDSSDTTMVSNLRAELEKSGPSVSVSPSASARQLPSTEKQTPTAPIPSPMTETAGSLNTKDTNAKQSIEPSPSSSQGTSYLAMVAGSSASSMVAEGPIHSPDIDKSNLSTTESAYGRSFNSSESNASFMTTETRNDTIPSTSSRYSQSQHLPSIPESKSAAARQNSSSVIPSDSAASGLSGSRDNIPQFHRSSRKRSQHESMLHARNQRIARFRADYTARKGSHRFASVHYSSNSSLTISGSNTSDASDYNNEQEVHLYNWKLKRIKLGEPWHSTRIVSRIDERTLVSSSGKVYKLKGELDVEGMLLNEFPLELCNEFQNGFPANWGKLILPHILPQSANVPSYLKFMNTDQTEGKKGERSSTLSTGTDYDNLPEPISPLSGNHIRPIDPKIENISPMSWRSQSSVPPSPLSGSGRTLLDTAPLDACGSDSCQGDHSNVSDTAYPADSSKPEIFTANQNSLGVQAVVPQAQAQAAAAAAAAMNASTADGGPLSQFSIHHIQANSVTYPHTPWGITYKTLKRRQDEGPVDSSTDYFQMPALKRASSGQTPDFGEGTSNKKFKVDAVETTTAENSIGVAGAPENDNDDDNHTTHTMADKETQSTIADGGTKFGVG
ncbi:hypothetical protein NQZ79_g7157 [Umbelopsis isabellina]|nr:hypothetical protein NQZ79_g7157 [Umbelopsis isabellina]